MVLEYSGSSISDSSAIELSERTRSPPGILRGQDQAMELHGMAKVQIRASDLYAPHIRITLATPGTNIADSDRGRMGTRRRMADTSRRPPSPYPYETPTETILYSQTPRPVSYFLSIPETYTPSHTPNEPNQYYRPTNAPPHTPLLRTSSPAPGTRQRRRTDTHRRPPSPYPYGPRSESNPHTPATRPAHSFLSRSSPQVHKPTGTPTDSSVPDLARNRDHDLSRPYGYSTLSNLAETVRHVPALTLGVQATGVHARLAAPQALQDAPKMRRHSQCPDCGAVHNICVWPKHVMKLSRTERVKRWTRAKKYWVRDEAVEGWSKMRDKVERKGVYSVN